MVGICSVHNNNRWSWANVCLWKSIWYSVLNVASIQIKVSLNQYNDTNRTSAIQKSWRKAASTSAFIKHIHIPRDKTFCNRFSSSSRFFFLLASNLLWCCCFFFSYFYIIFVFVFGLRLQCDFLNIRYKRCCLVQITLPQHNTHYHFLHYILWSLCFHSVHLSMYVCLHAVFYQLFFSNVLKISEQRKKKEVFIVIARWISLSFGI